jgi:two-component system, CitB family, response regulator DctR
MTETLAARRWQVLIVEDDPVVASVYKGAVGGMTRFEVAGVVSRGEDAIAFLQRHHCDLLLLDLKLAGMSGVTLLQTLRSSGHPIEVIALTATRNTETVRTIIQRGAIDYLVKPFTIDRLRQSLGLFLNRVSALGEDQLDQDAVDQICASGRVSRRWLPKGLTHAALGRVRDALATSPTPMSSSEVAEATGLARVTARRYLEYMVSTNEAISDSLPSGPGRPRKLYHSATIGLNSESAALR